MNAKEFFYEVKKMRKLQKEYFKTRSSITLGACKKQEKIIDDEIKRVQSKLDKTDGCQGLTLF